jgi:hypothetical protein
MPKFSKKQSLRKNRYSGGGQRRTKTSQKTKTAAIFGTAAAVIGSAIMGKKPDGRVTHRMVIADHKKGWTCDDLYELDQIPEDATCVAKNRGYNAAGKTYASGKTYGFTNYYERWVTPKQKEALLKLRRKHAEKAQKVREQKQMRFTKTQMRFTKTSKSKKR